MLSKTGGAACQCIEILQIQDSTFLGTGSKQCLAMKPRLVGPSNML
jgi:hypothetical protein